MQHFSRSLTLCLLLALALALLPVPVHAQDSPFPLPAPLFILTSDGTLLGIDPQTGAQGQISNDNQPVADFDVAPDGQWIAFRTADEGMVIVSNLNGFGGYVLNFEGSTRPAPGPAKTLAWSPDGGAIAYVIPGGVGPGGVGPGGIEIAVTGAGFYGEPDFNMVQGPWVELYWESTGSLIASDANGVTTRIRGTFNNWTLEAAPDMPARPQPPIPSYLSAEGVMLASGKPVPGTAGALAFGWGPLPLPYITNRPLPANLYFIGPDAGGIDQVWVAPQDGSPVRQVTSDVDPVISYGLSADGTQIAYAAGDALLVAPVGSNATAQILTPLLLEYSGAKPSWSPDGAQIAYYDERGVWVIPAAGGTPTLVAQSVPFDEQAGNISEIRFYFDPRWNADGTQLLIGIGLWEGAGLGVLDLTDGTITEMLQATVGAGRWTDDGRVLAWSSSFGYSEPGLLLLDPTQTTETLRLIENKPVYDVIPGADGFWYAVVGDSAAMGPVFARVWQAASVSSPYGPVFPGPAGGFAEGPKLAVRDGQFVIAGLRVQPTDAGPLSGALVVIEVNSGETGIVDGPPTPVHTITWGP